MEALETERRQMVKGRIGHASALEARIHLENMERVALIKTVPGGILQRTSRDDGVLAAQDIHSRLMEDLGDVGHLIDPHMTPERGDALFEHFAALNWSVHVNGYLMRDLPQMALEHMDEHILQVYDLWLEVPFKDTNYVDGQIAKLQEFAPQLFRADGSIDPYVDLSGTSTGTGAADRTMTAYWRSNDAVRETGLPIGSAVTCFLVGTLFSETIIVPALLAGACSAGASLGNREMNIASASEQYRQAAATGITMVSSGEARRRSNAWYAMEGLNAAFNAAMIAPMAGLWGRIGGAAIREGVAGATTGVAAISILSSFTSPLAAMGRVGSGVAGGTVNAAKWFWKLPVGSRLRLAGFAPAAVDGFFVDRQGNLVAYDGELNHWWGYAGMAAGMSETGFRIFGSAWQPGFSSAVSKSALREGAIHLGTDLIASDYYLIRNGSGGMQFVDFNASRDTALQEHAFQKQFAVDTWLGFAGTVLVSGDWLQNELRFGMTNWDRGLLISGAVPTGYDIISDGQLDSWYGGVGGSVVAAEMGYRLLNVNPAGSMVFLPMKLSYEWLMQAQQDVPLQAPDPQRMISSTVESIFMMMLVNGTYQGGHYWNTFPMGQSIFNAGQRLPLLNNLRCIEDLSRISFLGGNKPAIQGWSRGTAVRPFSTNGAVRTYKLRGDQAWNGLAQGREDVMLTVSMRNGSAVFNLNGAAVTEADLLSHGIVWNNNALYKFNPIREEYINIGGRRMTVQDLGMLNDGARARAMSQLRNSGWRIDGDRFSRWRVQRPYHPEVLTTRPTGPMSTSQFKIVESSIPGANGERIPVWLKLDREPMYANDVRLGGRDFLIWSGQREKPHFSFWGVALSGPPVLAEAYASNYFIFRKTSRGDPDYQPLQRFANYVPTVFFTWPVMQARRGLDSPMGRFLGGLVGYPANLLANWFFPTYRDSAPGQVTMYDHLDAGGSADTFFLNSNDAFSSFGRIVTSLNPGPWGPAHGSYYEIEDVAMDNLRGGLMCRMDMAGGTAFGQSLDCIELPDSTQQQIQRTDSDVTPDVMRRRFESWAGVFREKIEAERTGDLSERERRLLITLAGWFKSVVKESPEGDSVEPLKGVISEYKWLFDKVPTLTTDRDWEDFISQVNAGRSSVSNFYFDPHMQN